MNNDAQHNQHLIREYIRKILPNNPSDPNDLSGFLPKKHMGKAFAPANIALCKYWGKRDSLWNLPETNSLSISLGQLGATTEIRLLEEKDRIFLNGKEMLEDSGSFATRIIEFLDWFRPNSDTYYQIETAVNFPVAAGLASSAAGFAALTLAINDLYGWDLSSSTLSQLARLGSGSACRSIWHGFVEWQKGNLAEGQDSYGIPLEVEWPEFRVGLLIVDESTKPISSREAMEQTRATSFFYNAWKQRVEHDLSLIKTAICNKDFAMLGETAEANAQALHALMMTAIPPIIYGNQDTVSLWSLIRDQRTRGLDLYFTQDAGPNLKLLFLAKDENSIKKLFPNIQVVAPFEAISSQERLKC